jgi:hypothetical protein
MRLKAMSGDDRTSDEHLRYEVSLMIKHPSLDPARISQELGLVPEHSWVAGAPRRTPAGTSLPGTYPNSYWVTSQVVRGRRFFFEGAVAMLERLEAASEFIRGVTDSDGKVSITVNLYGGQNIGDAIDWSVLMRFAALEVELGVEVFPTMQRGW